MLLTSVPLSIQVHPDDDYARAIGLPNGKSEAWYILAADASSRVALGLKKTLTALEFWHAVDDGSIADLVDWRPVSAGDVIEFPAGKIHAIGPGLVLAEIQQSSDATFRLFDHGRNREIHFEHGLAVPTSASRISSSVLFTPPLGVRCWPPTRISRLSASNFHPTGSAASLRFAAAG